MNEFVMINDMEDVPGALMYLAGRYLDKGKKELAFTAANGAGRSLDILSSSSFIPLFSSSPRPGPFSPLRRR